MINFVVLTGRLVASPELKTTNTEKSVCSFRIAVNDGYGEKQKTYFINIVVWNKQAEYLCKYGEKGNKVMISGKYTDRSYTDKDGNEKKVVEIVANTIDLITNKDKGKNNPSEPTELKEPIEIECGDLPF